MRPVREVVGPLVHSWDHEDGIPTLSEPVARQLHAIAGKAMPKTEIRKRTRDYEWSSLESPGWKLLKSPNTVVRGDAPVEELRSASALAEEMNVILRTTLGGYEDIPVFSIRLFKEAQDFRRYAVRSGAANAEAFYDPRNSEMVMWFGTYATPLLVQRSFCHEFTHAYMDRVFRVTDPLWFAEGMAEYFSNVTWRHGMLSTGGVHPLSIEILKTQEPVPLETFLTSERGIFYSEQFPFLYAQAWSMVFFLFQYHPELIKQALRDRVAPDVRPLEKEWLEFLKELLAASP